MYCTYGFVSTFVLILAVIGVACPFWKQGPESVRQWNHGLWVTCYSFEGTSFSRCVPLYLGHQPEWFDASRVLLCLWLVFLAPLAVAAWYLHHRDFDFLETLALFLYAIFTAILGIVGVAVYAAMALSLPGSLSWAFYVEAAALIVHYIAALAVILRALDLRHRRRLARPGKVRPTPREGPWR